LRKKKKRRRGKQQLARQVDLFFYNFLLFSLFLGLLSPSFFVTLSFFFFLPYASWAPRHMEREKQRVSERLRERKRCRQGETERWEERERTRERERPSIRETKREERPWPVDPGGAIPVARTEIRRSSVIPVDAQADFRRASEPVTQRDSETRVTGTRATRNPPDPRALMPDPSPSFFLSLLYCFFSSLSKSQRERNREMREIEWEGDSENRGGEWVPERKIGRESESEERLGGRERAEQRERSTGQGEDLTSGRSNFLANHGGSEQRTPAELEDTIPGKIFGGD
jgi:hypothetical protein